MAKGFKTDKGHLVIRTTVAEFTDKCGGYGICDCCGTPMHGRCYYIPVLSSLFCHKCYKAWLATAKYYPEDADYEKRKYAFYGKLLGINTDN